MIAIQFKIDPSITKKIEELGAKALIGFSLGLRYSAFELRKAIQQLIRTSPRGGRRYRVGKGKNGKGLFHKASAPGEPPARDTGNLMNMLKARMEDPVTALVESLAGYSGYLEEGTSKMAARPFLKPALEQNTDVINRIIDEEIEKALR